MRIRVLHLLEGANEATGTTVIIDVFRAFTVEAYYMQGGADTVIPVADEELARALKRQNPSCILAGERHGRILPGFDYGNSPSQIQNIDFTGKTVIHTTSSGTQGLAGARRADEILTGSLVNARAIAEYIRRSGAQDVSLVCMGLGGRVRSEEDTLCAEYIKSLLEGNPLPLQDAIEDLKRTSGAKFFDLAQQDVFPEQDFYLSTEADKFPFVLKVEKGTDGFSYVRKIDIAL